MRFMPNARALPVTDVVTVYGADWCADCRRTKRYLDATRTPYAWVDVEADPAAQALVAAAGYREIPVVVTPSGQVLVEPSNDELANALGSAA
jgi:glutaredoxin